MPAASYFSNQGEKRMSEKTIDDLVKQARGRISAMRIAPPSGIESSRAAADEFERAIDALVALLPVGEPVMFYETVAKVEERFRKAYADEVVGNAKTEGQMEVDQVSTGWWAVLSRAGFAIRMGDERPAYQDGDDMVFVLQRKPKS